jgi:phospholipase/carboxylesterase
MALESTKASPAAAGRVVALAGRFESLPTGPAPETTIHLFHGKEDAVVPYADTIAAAQCLLELGTDVTADVIPFLGHEVSDELAGLVLERLRGYLPQRYWREALQADPAAGPGTVRATRAPL